MLYNQDEREVIPFDFWTIMILGIIFVTLLLALIESSQHARRDDPVSAEAPDQ
jgi:lipid-A-disaccharide synthase-like uncharacterized protein